jgi:hypothetical protein
VGRVPAPLASKAGDAPSRDLALGDGVVADAFLAGLVAGGARRQALVAAVLPQAAPARGTRERQVLQRKRTDGEGRPVAGGDVAERRGRGGGGGRGGLRGGGGRVVRRGGVPVVGGLIVRALEARHQGASQGARALLERGRSADAQLLAPHRACSGLRAGGGGGVSDGDDGGARGGAGRGMTIPSVAGVDDKAVWGGG